MILTNENFTTGLYALPHAESAPNEADASDKVSQYIELFEREILIKAVGVETYEEIVANKADFDNAPLPIKNLVKGAAYEINGTKVIWNGLDNSRSLLIPYVYCKYLYREVDALTTFGVERPEGVNSTAVSSIPRYTDAYRDFYEKYQGDIDYGGNYPRVIHRTNGIGLDYFGQDSFSQRRDRSLYQFVMDNSEDYDTSLFTLLEGNVNRYGL